MRLLPVVLLAAAAALPRAQAQKVENFGVCKSAAQRTRDMGCWILTDHSVGRIDKPAVYWHLDAYATHEAAEHARGPHGVIVHSLGKTWLMTIDSAGWMPALRGHHVADIGPLRVSPGKEYSATFMEAITKPGTTSAVHRHSGPEAWYTVAGETCLETPEGKIVGSANTPAIVPAGPPMFLTATGTQTRRAITLILHDASQPPTTMEHEWKPKGLCK